MPSIIDLLKKRLNGLEDAPAITAPRTTPGFNGELPPIAPRIQPTDTNSAENVQNAFASMPSAPPIAPNQVAAPPADISAVSQLANAGANLPAIAPALPQSQILQNQQNEFLNKQFGRVKNADGTFTAGRDHDTHSTWFDKLKNIVVGGVDGLAHGGLGGAIGGGIAGGLDRDYAAKFANNQKLQAIAPKIQAAQESEQFNQNARLKDAQIATIPIDDENRRQQIANTAEGRAATLKESKRKSFYSRNKFFDPAAVTEAQKREIAEFGETPESIGKYDFTKPNLKIVNGATYSYNAATKSFDETNLPKDGSKEIIEYTVKDPETGVESKYATTSEKAAGLKQSFVNAGLQIQAANTRQDKQISATASENAKNRKSAAERQQVSIEAAQKLAEFHDLQAKERAATTNEERATLQTQREQAAKDLAAFRDQLKDDN